MIDINLTISLWGQQRKISVSDVSGTGGIYHLYIDEFLHGQIFRRKGRFVIEYNKGCDLPGDELQGLFDMLGDGEKKSPA